MEQLDECRWGYTFLVTDSRLSEKSRLELIMKATTMYLFHQKKEKVRGDNYEGVLRSLEKYRLLGTFGGYHFEAELDTDYGKSRLSFLVAEHLCPEMN